MRYKYLFGPKTIIFLLAISAKAGHAQNVKITTPVDCSTSPMASCGEDLTLKEALEAYGKLKAELAKPCIHGEEEKYFGNQCGPFESVTERNVCDRVSAKSYYWATPKELTDGEDSLRTLLKRAKTGESFAGYRNGPQHVIVSASNSPAGEQHLALCSIRSVKGAVGPPLECATVAVITPDITLLRSDRNTGMETCTVSAEFRFNGAIDIMFDISTAKQAKDFTTPLINVLQSELSLTAEQRGANDDGNFVYITSVGSLRLSTVLPGKWWEALDFDLSVNRSERDKVVHVNGTAHVSVAGQPLGSLTKYQGMDDSQRKIYADKLNGEISKALRSSCSHSSQPDAKRIVCQ